MNVNEMYKLARKHLNQGGKAFREYCGLGASAPWCNAYVCYVFNESGNNKLFYDGKKVTYCPTSIVWCQQNLAQVPPYLAMAMDVIYFDWELNGVPNHIGFVRNRISTTEIRTHEGNTSGGIVAEKDRAAKYIQGIFRPHYKPENKPKRYELNEDGIFGYASIYSLQHVLGITEDCVLGKNTVKALQKKAGVKGIDGAWGPATSKKVQAMIGATQDGEFGKESVIALQKWINKQVCPQQVAPNGRTLISALKADTALETMTTYVGQSLAVINSKYRVIGYAKKDHSYQLLKVYNDKDKTGDVEKYTSLGHCNGMTYAKGNLYICSYHDDKNVKRITVADAITLKKIKKFAAPVALSSIAYDKKKGVFYGGKGSKVYLLGSDFKLQGSFKLKYTDGTNQDMFAYNGVIFVCRSYVEGSTSCIDTYKPDGTYLGSYTIKANELESADIDEDGYIHYLTWNKSRLIKTTKKV